MIRRKNPVRHEDNEEEEDGSGVRGGLAQARCVSVYFIGRPP